MLEVSHISRIRFLSCVCTHFGSLSVTTPRFHVPHSQRARRYRDCQTILEALVDRSAWPPLSVRPGWLVGLRKVCGRVSVTPRSCRAAGYTRSGARRPVSPTGVRSVSCPCGRGIRVVWRRKPAPGVIYQSPGRKLAGWVVHCLTRARETHNCRGVSRDAVKKPRLCT